MIAMRPKFDTFDPFVGDTSGVCSAFAVAPKAERHVVTRAQMRKQSVVLEDHADTTILRCDVDLGLRIVNNNSVDVDPTCRERLQSGDRTKDRCLARPVRPDQAENLARGDAELDIEPKRWEVHSNVCIERRSIGVAVGGHALAISRWRRLMRTMSDTATSSKLSMIAASGFVSNA